MALVVGADGDGGRAEVVQRRRLHDAVEALKAGTTSLADVAADLGYTDQAHFTHDFRTVTGMTPGDYLRDQPVTPPRG